jgi:outer membrane protein, heavy metal efflux system
MQRRNKAIAIVLFLFCASITHGQDTTRITISDADARFVQSNLQLLAQRYNTDIARAQIIQAKLFDNPTISAEAALVNPENQKVLDVSNSTGQYAIQLQQLIRLAGKRNKRVGIAETTAQLNEFAFFDLVRTLKYSLHSDFFQLFYLQQSSSAYQVQIATLEKLNTAYQDLLTKGIVTVKDALRIRALLYTLQAERASLQNQVNDLEADLQILLSDNKTWYVPVVDTAAVDTINLTSLNIGQLIDTAYANRYDLRLAETGVELSQRQYSYQKALAVPDLTVGAAFDKRGSYTNNASLLNMAIDLPFFNRNQGNIKAAKIAIDQSKIVVQQQQHVVENDVQRSYLKAVNTTKLLQSLDPTFRAQFEKLLLGVTENFQKKNISLLELVDFYESYKNNILQLNQLQSERAQAYESLQFAVGKNIFHY